MWSHCGVIKNKESLITGLKKIKEIKKKLLNLDVHINEYSCKEIIFAFDLESSVITAESTIISALQREESRGAHQRSDYPKTKNSGNFNILVKLEKNNNSLSTSKIPTKNLNSELRELVKNEIRDNTTINKLLE